MKRSFLAFPAGLFLLLFTAACSASSGYGGANTVVSAPRAQAELTVLSIGTADSGGSMYPAGAAIAGVINRRDSGIRVNVSASSGSAMNLEEIESGQLDLGLISADVANAALSSEERQDSGLRAVAAVYTSYSNWMAPSESGLTRVRDLAGKSAVVGPRDSTSALAAARALDAAGILARTELLNSSLGSGSQAVRDGEADAIHGFAGIPIPSLEELAGELPCRLLSYAPQELKTILAQNPAYFAAVIPAGTYPGQETDVPTFGVKCLLCADESLDEAIVYQITQILLESGEELSASFAPLAAMSEDGYLASDLIIPLHPGAEACYRDAGLLPAAADSAP